MSVLKQASTDTEVHDKQEPSRSSEGKSARYFSNSSPPLARTISNILPPQLASLSARLLNNPDKDLEVRKQQGARAMRAASIV